MFALLILFFGFSFLGMNLLVVFSRDNCTVGSCGMP
jgi:hypothetical protein